MDSINYRNMDRKRGDFVILPMTLCICYSFKVANLTNPEAFQFEAATILAAAYSEFPVPIDWIFDSDNELYPTDRGRSRREIQESTIHWLVDNGYLGGDSLKLKEGWKRLELTERGLSALNAVPEALAGREPLGKRLVMALGTNSLDMIRQLVPVLISQAIQGSNPG